jgi:glycosyltransferase involved in cell wall biosynthesis
LGTTPPRSIITPFAVQRWCSLVDMTRIGLICGYLDRKHDGVADYSLRLAAHLTAAADLQPILITTHSWSDVSEEPAVGVTKRWDVVGVLAAARSIPKLNLDLIHVQFAPSVFGFSRAVGLLPLLLPRHIRLIVTLHEYGVWTPRRPGHGLVDRLWSALERRGWIDRETWALVPRADRLLVPSAEHFSVLAARFGGRLPPTREVPIGLNVQISSRDNPARAAVRRDLGMPADAPLVAFFGFFHPVKALDQLIIAVSELRDTWPDVHLLLLGGIESHSVDASAAHGLLELLDKAMVETGMRERVHITGYLPDEEISRMFGAADVAAFPLNDGVTSKSGSLLTAFALGVPVIATAPPGEVTTPTEIGGVLRVPPRNTSALVAALRLILTDHALADRLRAAGHAATARRSWDVITAAHRQIYAEALELPTRGLQDKRSQPWQS